jgi:hypothetical protein
MGFAIAPTVPINVLFTLYYFLLESWLALPIIESRAQSCERNHVNLLLRSRIMYLTSNLESLSRILEKAPFMAVNYAEPNPQWSADYRPIDSLEVVAYMASRGWTLRAIECSDNANPYASHLMRFARESGIAGAIGKSEIVILNSGNRRVRLTVAFGMFVHACHNGLVWRADSVTRRYHRVGHMETWKADVDSAIKSATKESRRFFDMLYHENICKADVMTVTSALLRKVDISDKARKVIVDSMQLQKHNMLMAKSLWHIFNDVQAIAVSGINEPRRLMKINMRIAENAMAIANS